MNEQELDELLRSRPEPLQPPAGRWESVRRRARRRRMAKLGVAVLATVVVAVGIGLGPSLLFTQNHRAVQRVSIAAGPSSAPTAAHRDSPVSPTPNRQTTSPTTGRTGLRDFSPTSVSFVSQDEGFLLGVGGRSRTTLARTTNAGRGWTRLADPPIQGTTAGTGVRFATPEIGFVFGARYLVTTDAAASWTAEPSPGYISDLETMRGHVYALVRACSGCRGQTSLWEATTTSPRLTKVAGVPNLSGGSVSLAVFDDAAYVLDTGKGTSGQVWGTLNGASWSSSPSPCGASNGVLTEWSPTGLAAACDGSPSEAARVFTSVDGAQTWTPLATSPPRTGDVRSVSAANPDDVVLAVAGAGFASTTDAGSHWSSTRPQLADGARFVGFISPNHVVGLAAGPNDRFFTSSYDAGDLWDTTPFPR